MGHKARHVQTCIVMTFGFVRVVHAEQPTKSWSGAGSKVLKMRLRHEDRHQGKFTKIYPVEASTDRWVRSISAWSLLKAAYVCRCGKDR